jgi:hypothetical protein
LKQDIEGDHYSIKLLLLIFNRIYRVSKFIYYQFERVRIYCRLFQ